MYRGTLEPKKYTNILRKNGSFSNKTSCGLTALFLKTKIYFCCCNVGNKQIKKIPTIFCSYCICRFGNGTPNLWAPTKNVAV